METSETPHLDGGNTGAAGKNKRPIEESDEHTQEHLSLSHVEYGICGFRHSMEDRVTSRPKFMFKSEELFLDFFGVYDGHGGDQVANVCKERLHFVLQDSIDAGFEEQGNRINWKKVMDKCFHDLGYETHVDGTEVQNMRFVGSTAVVALVSTKEIVVANCGDSRAVLSRNGRPIPLSFDHKPDRPDEYERITNAGVNVVFRDCWRVHGVYSVSRAIGDAACPAVISVPEVTVTNRSRDDEFLILASDGLWDVIPNEMACNVVRELLLGDPGRDFEDSYERLRIAAVLLVYLAIFRGSSDNISMVIIELNEPSKPSKRLAGSSDVASSSRNG